MRQASVVQRAHELKWEELNLSSNHNYQECNVSEPTLQFHHQQNGLVLF